MITENNFIKHIVEMKKSVDVWPEWKKTHLVVASIGLRTSKC